MNFDFLLSKLNNWDVLQRAVDNVKQNESICVSSVDGPAAHYFALAFERALGQDRKILYIAENELAAKRACDDFNDCFENSAVLIERSEYMLYNAVAKSEEVDYRRMEAIKRILSGDFRVAVVSPQALAQYMLPPDEFANAGFVLKVGETHDIIEVTEKLSEMGYVRVPNVDGKRQFSQRGDILDVFPTNSDTPYRIEFYGDEIDTIREFSAETQRSVMNVAGVSIFAESELQLGLQTQKNIFNRIQDSFENKLSRVTSGELKRKYEQATREEMEFLGQGVNFAGRDRYVPFAVGKDNNIFDYFDNPLIFSENYQNIIANIEALNQDHYRVCESLSDTICVLDELYHLYLTRDEAVTLLNLHEIVYLDALGCDNAHADLPQYEIKFSTVPTCNGNDVAIDTLLKSWAENDYEIYLITEREESFSNYRDILKKHNEDIEFGYIKGTMASCFVATSLGFVIAPPSTFYVTSVKKKTSKRRAGEVIERFSDIEPGDYVVHDVHGIGIFEGVQQYVDDGITRDYAVIRYAEGGSIWIPSFQLDTIHKYIGKEDVIPRISSLSGKDWQREKEKVKKQLRCYVQELVDLYAKRSEIKGHAFSPDSDMQRNFEADFEYEPTEDQLKSTAEIKEDMEDPRPMERLLCGDVGFGKTEVALRAAFKAVYDGCQVAFLCPTTVLAQQHYNTIRARLKNYPVNVDYICRFRTAKERTEIAENAKNGKIDILIGTHAILAKAVEFKNLGLIIIDEEQRFGVMQKEKLKLKWPTADLLYLSATPIPRTLNMSLSKIRDISLLSDAPRMRSPVQTYVIEWDPLIIKNAIYREMARGGQVFYLFNVVSTMPMKFKTLQELVPEARIAMAHGQMPERELENVMQAFVNGEYDVLLCSAIIESGLDIPNANTIIVENGHRLGLAQMYQIRGRVGRSDTRAYAYITFPKGISMSDEAEKRLRTIKEFTEFGSGFKVAMRDLQIRGAGSVLGERQHGDVSSVGYEMYTKILNNMVVEATGGTVEEEVQFNIKIDVDSFIPYTYITDEPTRLEIYHKISAIESDVDIIEMTDELIDRFPGDVPEKVINLMHISKIRALAEKAGFNSVSQKNKIVEFGIYNIKVFEKNLQISYNTLNRDYRNTLRVMTSDKRYYAELTIGDKYKKIDQKDVLAKIEKFLGDFIYEADQ